MALQDYYPGKTGYCRIAMMILWFLSLILAIVAYAPTYYGEASYGQIIGSLLAVYIIVMTIVFAMSCIPFSGVIVLVDIIVCLIAGGLIVILAIVDLVNAIQVIDARSNCVRQIYRSTGWHVDSYYEKVDCKQYVGYLLLIDAILYVVIAILCALIAYFEFQSAPGGVQGLVGGGHRHGGTHGGDVESRSRSSSRAKSSTSTSNFSNRTRSQSHHTNKSRSRSKSRY